MEYCHRQPLNGGGAGSGVNAEILYITSDTDLSPESLNLGVRKLDFDYKIIPELSRITRLDTNVAVVFKISDEDQYPNICEDSYIRLYLGQTGFFTANDVGKRVPLKISLMWQQQIATYE